ncbi:MAG TPA: peptide chain release factor N(5)-glutamine methyltransferase [Thermoanaerobaculia bacterium]
MKSSADADKSWGALLAEGRRRLSGADHAPYEAEELLARAAARPRAWFLGRRRKLADPATGAAFAELVARRAAGEPLQYLLGEWEFMGRTFFVDPRALIPRGETEGIVEAAHAAAAGARRIVDLGTGSGILAVSLALERPGARVVATDRSLAALALTAANARRHGVAARVIPVAADWLSAFPRRPLFDLVVANPPYVSLTDAPHLSKTVSEFEPPLALYGGGDGLDPLRVLLAALPAVLQEGAPFVFEFGYGQARDVSALVDASGGFRLAAMRLDAAGIPRTATAVRL